VSQFHHLPPNAPRVLYKRHRMYFVPHNQKKRIFISPSTLYMCVSLSLTTDSFTSVNAIALKPFASSHCYPDPRSAYAAFASPLFPDHHYDKCSLCSRTGSSYYHLAKTSSLGATTPPLEPIVFFKCRTPCPCLLLS
jgi:hypothetical protein